MRTTSRHAMVWRAVQVECELFQEPMFYYDCVPSCGQHDRPDSSRGRCNSRGLPGHTAVAVVAVLCIMQGRTLRDHVRTQTRAPSVLYSIFFLTAVLRHVPRVIPPSFSVRGRSLAVGHISPSGHWTPYKSGPPRPVFDYFN